MVKQYKTSGEVRKVFSNIGRVGGNRVKGLIAGGRLFNVIWQKHLIDEKTLRQVAEEAGVTPEDMEAAFAIATQAREDLEELEEEHETPPRSKRKTA
jgi:hypothetical protein